MHTRLEMSTRCSSPVTSFHLSLSLSQAWNFAFIRPASSGQSRLLTVKPGSRHSLLKTLQRFSIAIRPTARPLTTASVPRRVRPAPLARPASRLASALAAPRRRSPFCSHTGQAPLTTGPWHSLCSPPEGAAPSSAWPLRPAFRTLRTHSLLHRLRFLHVTSPLSEAVSLTCCSCVTFGVLPPEQHGPEELSAALGMLSPGRRMVARSYRWPLSTGSVVSDTPGRCVWLYLKSQQNTGKHSSRLCRSHCASMAEILL